MSYSLCQCENPRPSSFNDWCECGGKIDEEENEIQLLRIERAIEISPVHEGYCPKEADQKKYEPAFKHQKTKAQNANTLAKRRAKNKAARKARKKNRK